jgi:hypothetical protein
MGGGKQRREAFVKEMAFSPVIEDGLNSSPSLINTSYAQVT